MRLELGDPQREREFMAIHLYEQPPRGSDQRPNLHHVGIRSFNLPALLAHMEELLADGSFGETAGLSRGGRIISTHTFRYCMASDPDGLLLELYEDRASASVPWPATGPKLDAKVALSNLYLSHAHIFCTDVDTTVLWLAKAFGSTVSFELENAAGARNIWLNIGGGGLNLYDQPPRKAPRALVHHLGMRTDNLPALLAHLRQGGIAYRDGQQGKGEQGWRYAMCMAPDGLLLEIFENRAGFNPNDADVGAP